MPPTHPLILGTGAQQSPEDYRYINLEHLAGIAPKTFPSTYSIDYSKVDYLNQRKIGECTNDSYSEIAMHKSLRIGKQISVSPRFTYALSKINDGVMPLDNQATYPVMPFKMGAKFGVATTAVCAHDTTLPFETYIYDRNINNIPEQLFANADQNRPILGYAQVGGFNSVSEQNIKAALMSEGGRDGVSFLIRIGDEFWTDKDGNPSWARSAILPIRKTVNPVGGHQLVATGWETEQGTGRMKLFFRNHWSRNWASTSGIQGGTDVLDLDGGNGWLYFDEHPIIEAWIGSDIPAPILSIVKSLPKRADFKLALNRQLVPGDVGEDVKQVQTALKVLGFFALPIETTNYFGPITQKAVRDFQLAYNIATLAEINAACGAVGPKTRAALTKIF